MSRPLVFLLLLLCASFLQVATIDAAEPPLTRERVKAAVPALEKLINDTLSATGVPGMAIAIVHEGEVIHVGGYGVREAGKPAKVNSETVFLMASVSKPMATTVIASVVGDGKVDWDDRVTDRLPGFQMSNPYVTREVTLRDFLCHRSGLPSQAGDLLEDIGYDRAAILHRLRFEKPASSFRSAYAYTNFGFTAAAEAAARAAGQPWEELCETKLYKPLGMSSTSSRYADFVKRDNRALIHVKRDGTWQPRFTRDADAQAPAGGVSSNAVDMAKWMILQLDEGKFGGKQIVDAKALAETHRPQMISGFQAADNHVSLYGLGWGVSNTKGRVFWRHSGAFFIGERTEVALLPAGKLGIITFSNGAPTGLPEAINDSFFELVLNGELKSDWVKIWNGRFDQLVAMMVGQTTDFTRKPAEQSPAQKLKSYTGTYTNDYFGDAQISESEGKLILKLGPKKLAFPMPHYNRDVFTYVPEGESSGGLGRPSGVTFTVAADGQAMQVVIENLNETGQGTFVRKQK